jgi:hypothetical protein
MAAEKDDKEANQSDMQPRIRWDTSKMRSADANVFNVACTIEEVILLFGVEADLVCGAAETEDSFDDSDDHELLRSQTPVPPAFERDKGL